MILIAFVQQVVGMILRSVAISAPTASMIGSQDPAVASMFA